MKKNKNNTNIWRLQNIQLKTQRINKEIKLETRNAFKMHKKQKYTFQNLYYTAKPILGENFIAVQAYFKKLEISQANNTNIQRNQKKRANKAQRKGGNNKIRAEINKIETGKKKILMKLSSIF